MLLELLFDKQLLVCAMQQIEIKLYIFIYCPNCIFLLIYSILSFLHLVFIKALTILFCIFEKDSQP